MTGRKEVRGGAGTTTLTSGITGGSASMQLTGSVAGYPTGATYPFVLKIDPSGLLEKVLCSGLTGTGPATVAITTRGFDGTSAVAHNAGVFVQHCIDADSLDTLFAHVFDTTRDDHPQYIKTNGTRGFSAVSAIAGSPMSVGVANSPGTALTLARSDHVHVLGPNTVFVSNIIDGAVSKAKLDPSIGTTWIVADAIGLVAAAVAGHDGDSAYQVDTKARFYLNGGLWIPDAPEMAPNSQDITWAANTVNFDMQHFTIPAVGWPTIIRPTVQMQINPGDAVLWDATIQLWTGAIGTGAMLGSINWRNNPGTNSRFPVYIPCDELAVAAATTQDLYLRCVYSTATPTVGFTRDSKAISRLRTYIRTA